MDKKSNITKKALLKAGWVEGKDTVYPAKKKLPNDIELVVNRLYNCEMFAVAIPGGGLLNFQVSTMKELKAFEKAIVFYDPPF